MHYKRCQWDCTQLGALGYKTGWRCRRCGSVWLTFEQPGCGMTAADGYAKPLGTREDQAA